MDKIAEFMKGRYGFDGLDVGLLLISVVLDLISMIIGGSTATKLSIAALLPIIICVVRFLSKNKAARQKENQIFLNLLAKLFYHGETKENQTIEERELRSNQKKAPISAEDKKNYKFFKCPNCKQKVRVPRGKGKIEILCPNCSNRFIKKT